MNRFNPKLEDIHTCLKDAPGGGGVREMTGEYGVFTAGPRAARSIQRKPSSESVGGCNRHVPLAPAEGFVGFLSWRERLMVNPVTKPHLVSSYAIGPSRPLSGSACRSWRREVILSLAKMLPRWYWIVRGLRNSWAAISGLDKPDLGQPGDLDLLRGELGVHVGGALAGDLAGGPQLAAGALGERRHADRGEHVVRGAQLRPSLGPAALATQPLTVEQVGARQLGTKAGAAQPADRLAIVTLPRALPHDRIAAV
jgi:hypothetical protein